MEGYMKKKILITLGILVTLIVASVAGVAVTNMNAPKHPSEYKIGISYDEAVKSDKPMLAVFYVDWCGYCLRFMPKFRILNTLYKNKYNFVMINVEGDQNTRALAEDVGIAGYPTVYILDPKYDNRVLLSNSYYHNLKKFRVELDRYLRIRALLDKATAEVEK
jgi:thiol-disulfide isomerase/thioredoxin